MTASPFPTETPSPFEAIAEAIEIQDRGTHIPAWYVRNRHQEPEKTVVKHKGEPLKGFDGNPFTVAQVAPERRYAIGLDGEVMDVNDFRSAHQQAHLEYYEVLRRRHPNAQFTGQIDLIPIPNPADWVKWGVDPEDSTKLRQIGYDPKRPAGMKPEYFYNAEGEKVEGSRIEHLCNAYADPQLRKSLKTHEIAEVEEHLGISSRAGHSEVAAKLEQLTELMNDGAISVEVYAKKVAALTGKAPEAEEKAEETETDPNIARCGHKCKPKGKAVHEFRCKKCKALFEEDAANALKESEDEPTDDD